MTDKWEQPEPLELDDFEIDLLKRMIAGEITTEVLVGDGKLLDLASLRERVRPRSALAEIDRRVAERMKSKEDPNG